MDLTLALATVLHILVLVYWLGGDLGAFYASTILTDAKQSVSARAAAANVLAQVDMAPRTALILAFPSGATLAMLTGWLALEPWHIGVIWAGFLVWLALAWGIHMAHLPPDSTARQLDLMLRVLVASALIAVAIWPSAFFSGATFPLFLQGKCAILAACIVCGLGIRKMLAPFGPAFAALMRDGASEATNATIATSLDRARPFVLLIWALLIAAAFLGVAKPV